jgi:hypothetical protein
MLNGTLLVWLPSASAGNTSELLTVLALSYSP